MRTQVRESERSFAADRDVQAPECNRYPGSRRNRNRLLLLLILGITSSWDSTTRAGTNDVIAPGVVDGPIDPATVNTPSGASPPDDVLATEPGNGAADALDPLSRLGESDVLMVTVSEPLSLSIPEFVDNVVGKAMGRMLRGGLARVKLANLEMAVDQVDNQATNVTFMPTSQITANGRFAGNAIRGEAELRRIEAQDVELDAFPSGSLHLGRELSQEWDVRLYTQKSRSTLTSGLQFDVKGAHPATAGYRQSWYLQPERTRYAEGTFDLSYQAGSRLRIQSELYRRAYETGSRIRWLDWSFIVELDQLRGPIRVTWRQMRSRDVYVFDHTVAVGRGVYASWLVQHALDRKSAGSEQTVALGAAFRRVRTTLFRFTWIRDRTTDRDRLQFDMNRIWHLGPFDVGRVRFACRELAQGVWETRLGGTFVVPVTFEHSTEGGVRQRWGH